MITETLLTRERCFHTNERSTVRRRHHTLDNGTLDQFNFICVPLNRDEMTKKSQNANILHHSSSQTALNRTNLSSPTRRVRFKLDHDNHNQVQLDSTQNTRSSDDLRLIESNPIHRVEFQIPMYNGNSIRR